MKIIIAQAGGGQVAAALLIFTFVVFISIGIFLLIRSIMLWYWKVDKIVENQNKQLSELQKSTALMGQLIQNIKSDNLVKND